MSENENDAPAEEGPAPPSGPAFPLRIICGLLELSDRRLQQLVAEGWIPRAVRGQYSLRDSVRGYIRYLKQAQRDSNRGGETARLARAQAVKVEMENFRRMGELGAWPQLFEVMAGLIVQMKASHEGVPGRLASELAAISDPPLVYKRLQQELRRIDDLCADYLEQRAAAFESLPRPGETTETLSPDDADEVGGSQPDHAPGQS